MKNILLISIVLSLLIPCDNGYENFMGECYFSYDVDVLREILINSIETINMDMDNSSWSSESSIGNENGIMEPLEICSQSWENGRLKSLDCGAHIINGNYDWCDLSGPIPNTITNWSEIETLILDYNNFSGIVPENICTMDFDFSNPNLISLSGNNLCPPYPACIEAYIDNQNISYPDCEINECYNLDIGDFISFELGGDNLLNPLQDSIGRSFLGINLFNDGPSCGHYPGIRIETTTAGVTFNGLSAEEEGYETWWYGISAQGEYGWWAEFMVSPFIPNGTVIEFTAEAITLNCEESCVENPDPFCFQCPLTEPVTLSLTISESFTNSMGDSNFDGTVDILDIVKLVIHITTIEPDQYYGNLMFLISDLNEDYMINIQDIILIINIILDNN